MSDAADRDDSIDLSARMCSYRLLRAALSADQSREWRVTGIRDLVAGVLAESGVDGLTEVAVELSLKLAGALERLAGDQGLAALDLANVWLVD